jgi:transposase
MDAGYDCEAIREHSRKLGHVPIIRRQKRGTQNVEMDRHQKVRYRERTGIERAFSRLKDEFGFSTVKVRGVRKVLAHLMFGILALTADQILRWCGLEGGLAPSPI